ncbi:peptidylprolyl isomerase, FKBP-type [Novosphingobium sp. Rr 2-17]|uniref:FKBP-type peptidyl-prolyl cis-trans isomerase n=1 Tax=Novosphingobium sp. Rr 2-17 TaxID=555793 RepID=UPI00026988B5|nr:FKBP-type peptidyl-prolyl cis-trans isomerase [Novosphingobium sp. Rr 2-17]EIZ78617.1 peptidylprolyl isomerase, FKBP-type [Novosphingobium sp. Rr 2-17]
MAIGVPALGYAQAPAAPAPASPAAAPHVKVDSLTPGAGDKVPEHAMVLVNYKGMLQDGTVFDEAQRSALPLDEVVPGFSQGIVGMQRGGKYRVTIPPQLGYGAQASGPIPANSTLVFEIELIDFKTPQEISQLMAQMAQQQGQQQAQPQGAPPAK